MFKEADTNGDGALNKAEWQDHHAKKFDEMDANKDGKLTKEELQNFHQARMKEMQERHQKMNDHKGMQAMPPKDSPMKDAPPAAQ
jgi:polyhydroxyalkanoate synthesis regulator phasin